MVSSSLTDNLDQLAKLTNGKTDSMVPCRPAESERAVQQHTQVIHTHSKNMTWDRLMQKQNCLSDSNLFWCLVSYHAALL